MFIQTIFYKSKIIYNLIYKNWKISLSTILLSLTLALFFQNCQNSKSNFETQDSKATYTEVLQLNLVTAPVNSENCNDGIKLIIFTQNNLLAKVPYSFDGGKSWSNSFFNIYTQSTTIEIGQIMVKDVNGATVFNMQPYSIDLINCSGQIVQTSVPANSCSAPSGSFCPLGTSTPEACKSGFYCLGGAAVPLACPNNKICPPGISVPESCYNGTVPNSDKTNCIPMPMNGSCGNTLLGCTTGSPTNVNFQSICGTTTNWNCSGLNNGVSSHICSFANPACTSENQPIDGKCGTSLLGCKSGIIDPNYNTQSLCGTTSTWFCNGTNGGATSEQCSLSNANCPAVIDGLCDNSVARGCYMGNPINDNGITTCGTQRTWTCSGQNNGVDSSQCSIQNSACL